MVPPQLLGGGAAYHDKEEHALTPCDVDGEPVDHRRAARQVHRCFSLTVLTVPPGYSVPFKVGTDIVSILPKHDLESCLPQTIVRTRPMPHHADSQSTVTSTLD